MKTPPTLTLLRLTPAMVKDYFQRHKSYAPPVDTAELVRAKRAECYRKARERAQRRLERNRK